MLQKSPLPPFLFWCLQYLLIFASIFNYSFPIDPPVPHLVVNSPVPLLRWQLPAVSAQLLPAVPKAWLIALSLPPPLQPLWLVWQQQEELSLNNSQLSRGKAKDRWLVLDSSSSSRWRHSWRLWSWLRHQSPRGLTQLLLSKRESIGMFWWSIVLESGEAGSTWISM